MPTDDQILKRHLKEEMTRVGAELDRNLRYLDTLVKQFAAAQDDDALHVLHALGEGLGKVGTRLLDASERLESVSFDTAHQRLREIVDELSRE